MTMNTQTLAQKKINILNLGVSNNYYIFASNNN